MHDSGAEDRIFDLRCGYLEQTAYLSPSCYWTGYLNDYDDPVDFSCPNNGYINGFHSIHDNQDEDRKMKFRCCTLPGMCVYGCYGFPRYVNDYDQRAYHSVPTGQLLHGVKSIHEDKKEDRRWSFNNCYMKRC